MYLTYELAQTPRYGEVVVVSEVVAFTWRRTEILWYDELIICCETVPVVVLSCGQSMYRCIVGQ